MEKGGRKWRLFKKATMALKAKYPDSFYLGSDSDADYDLDDFPDDDESHPSDVDSSDDERAAEIYSRSVYESDGFNVVIPGNLSLWNAIVPVHIHQYSHCKAECEEMAKFAIEKQNEKEKSNLEFVEVKKANVEMVSGSMFYLTLLVKDNEVGRDLICEAKVWDRIKEDKVLELFRIKMVDEGK